MARQLTPEQAAAALDAVAVALPEALRDAALHGARRISFRTGGYMRDAKGEPKRRSPSDSGPLRIVTGRLAAAAAYHEPGPNRQGAVNRIDDSHPTRVTLEKGVDLSAVPYARIHERGGTAGRGARIPARPYLGPALDAATPEVTAYAEKALAAALDAAVGR